MAQQSVTKIISVTIMNLVAPKAGAEHELLFNEPTSVQLGLEFDHGQTLANRTKPGPSFQL